MGTRTRFAALLLLAALAAGLAGCGEEEAEREVVEGEPLELDGVSYNVQITRFLNPDDPEDEAYLHDQPEAPRGQSYLGVFMVIENEGDEPAEIPSELRVLDTLDREYEPLESESLYALELGSTLAPGAELPEPETAPATGPIQGAMVLFLVDDAVAENRPLVLEIPSASGEVGEVELDI